MNRMNFRSDITIGMPISGQRFRGVPPQDRLQHHAAALGQEAVAGLEERRVPLLRERLDRLEADDAVDRLVELLPAAQQHPPRAVGVHAVEKLLDEFGLVLAQGQPDDVHVVLLDRPLHDRAPPAATDVEQRHAGLEIQLAEGEIDLRHLRLGQRHVVALVVRTAVRPRRILEQTEEDVGEVVVRLDLFEVRFHVVTRLPRFPPCSPPSVDDLHPNHAATSFVR